jgi:hypothetical protein
MPDDAALDAAETIVGTFLEAFHEVFPDEDDKLAMLARDRAKLLGDARTLLAFGISTASLCSIVKRDMRRLRELGRVSPVTLRFCIRSVENAAKVGSTMHGKVTADMREAARRDVKPADFSVADYRRLCCQRHDDSGHHCASLSMTERWRWHAYMRGWRRRMGFTGPPPFDPGDEWRAPELEQPAAAAVAAAIGVERKPSPPESSRAWADADAARHAAREQGWWKG